MIRGFTIPVHHLVFETLHLGKQFIFLKNPIKTMKFKNDFQSLNAKIIPERK